MTEAAISIYVKQTTVLKMPVTITPLSDVENFPVIIRISVRLKTSRFIKLCKVDMNHINRQPKTAKSQFGHNHHVLNSRPALTRRATLNTSTW